MITETALNDKKLAPEGMQDALASNMSTEWNKRHAKASKRQKRGFWDRWFEKLFGDQY